MKGQQIKCKVNWVGVLSHLVYANRRKDAAQTKFSLSEEHEKGMIEKKEKG